MQLQWQKSIPFLIFERDLSSNTRPQGWGITIHFALNELLELLPDSISARLDSAMVNPSLPHDAGNFLFLNLSNCDIKWRIPPTERKRLSRDRFRQLLLGEGMENEVLWGKHLVSVIPTAEGVTAYFNDGSCYKGLLLVGADGALSTVRSLLCSPRSSTPVPLPIHFIGTALEVTRPYIEPLLALDPILFQGCHPATSTYMWFSVMETPETNGTLSSPAGGERWKIQLCLSWPSHPDDVEIPETNAARILLMREKTAVFDSRLRRVFHDALPQGHSPVISINLADWCPPVDPWENFGGRITLAGDAAHSMTMCMFPPAFVPALPADQPIDRGEGLNHGILDVYNLLPALEKMYDTSVTTSDETRVRMDAIAFYEEEFRLRGRQAVLLSRDACLQAHQWDQLNEESAVLTKRTRIHNLYKP